MTGRVLAPTEALDVLDARLPRMSKCYGAVVIHDAEGKAIDRGTVSFCEVQGRRLLLTANHMAVAHEGHDSTLLHYELDPEDNPLLETISRGRRATVRPNVVYRDAVLDVAALAVPDEVSEIAGITWMDLDDGVRAARKAAAWFAEISPAQTLATIAFGFGNYSTLEDAQRRQQVFAGGPLPCEVRAWDAEEARAPLIRLEPYVEADDLRARELQAIERQIVDRLSNWDDGSTDEDPAAFGGYSGGPLLLVSDTSEHLIGVVIQGTRRPGVARLHATPLTAFVDALKKRI
jgi:hypothetical protein